MSANDTYQGTRVSSGKVVPLISSYVVGPLGVAHLPRLWLKALLHAKNILAEDWGCGPGGLDKRLMHALGIDAQAFMEWLMREMPAYPQSEAWVVEHATNLTPHAIAESNTVMYTLPLPRDLGPQFRSFMQLDASIDVGIMLDNYDDWQTVHRSLTTAQPGERDAVVPAISPRTTGWSGIANLPRQWLRDTLAALDALPSGYPAHEAADDAVLRALAIDPAVARGWIGGELSTFVEYERRICSQAQQPAGEIVWDALPGLGADEIAATEMADRQRLHESIIARIVDGPAPEAGVLAFDISRRLRS